MYTLCKTIVYMYTAHCLHQYASHDMGFLVLFFAANSHRCRRRFDFVVDASGGGGDSLCL